jgi:hypothetical protein
MIDWCAIVRQLTLAYSTVPTKLLSWWFMNSMWMLVGFEGGAFFWFYLDLRRGLSRPLSFFSSAPIACHDGYFCLRTLRSENFMSHKTLMWLTGGTHY